MSKPSIIISECFITREAEAKSSKKGNTFFNIGLGYEAYNYLSGETETFFCNAIFFSDNLFSRISKLKRGTRISASMRLDSFNEKSLSCGLYDFNLINKNTSQEISKEESKELDTIIEDEMPLF